MGYRKIKGVTRIDQPENSTHGWYARVTWKGHRYLKWFNDAKYGGKQRAHAAAAQWVAAKHAALGKPFTRRRVVTLPLAASGVLGVSTYPTGYLVSWHPRRGVQKRAHVPLARGLAAARRLRREKAAEMYASATITV